MNYTQNLRKKNSRKMQKRNKEIEKCKRDPIYFAEKYVRVMQKDGTSRPIRFTKAQKIH